MPRISIVTPTFNSEKYLETLIHSVEAQGYEYYEHIFIDNGSTDKTQEIIKRYTDRHPCNVRLFVMPGLFVGAAVTIGFKLSKGDIVGWIDSDDKYELGAWGKALIAFEKYSVDVVYGDTNIIDANGEFKRHLKARTFDIREAARDDYRMFFCSTFYRRELLGKAGYLNDLGNQMDFYIRLAKQGKMVRINETLASWREHDNQYSNPYHPKWSWVVSTLFRQNYYLGLRNGGNIFSKRSIRYYRYLLFNVLGVYTLRRKLGLWRGD